MSVKAVGQAIQGNSRGKGVTKRQVVQCCAPYTVYLARRRQRQRQSIDLADALAHARWVAAGSHDYRSMTLRQLRTHARARFGPQYWQELETRGSRHTALVNLLYSTDGGGH